MAQQVKATAKPYDLSLVPGWRELTSTSCFPIFTYMFWHMPLTQNELINVNKYFTF